MPASIAQEHFWLFDQLLPGLPLFNIPYVIRLLGALNVAILEQSFNEIIRRHEALRTTFATVDGATSQIIAPTLHMPLTVQDLRHCPRPSGKTKPGALMQEESRRSFDLTQGPLLRGCLLRLGEQDIPARDAAPHHQRWLVASVCLCMSWPSCTTPLPLACRRPCQTLPIQYADFASGNANGSTMPCDGSPAHILERATA